MGAELPFEFAVEVVTLVASPVHRYEGRPGDGALAEPGGGDGVRSELEIRAHRGVVGDRYFGREAHRQASVTLMAAESLTHVEQALALDAPLNPALARRNIVLHGVDVDLLAGAPFSLDTGNGPVLFDGHRPANPCGWMNVVLADGAHRALRGRGGVRCEPVSDGRVRLGPGILCSSVDVGWRNVT